MTKDDSLVAGPGPPLSSSSLSLCSCNIRIRMRQLPLQLLCPYSPAVVNHATTVFACDTPSWPSFSLPALPPAVSSCVELMQNSCSQPFRAPDLELRSCLLQIFAYYIISKWHASRTIQPHYPSGTGHTPCTCVRKYNLDHDCCMQQSYITVFWL